MTDHGLSLRETAGLLRFSPSTFRRLDREGWIARWGLVELPRVPGGKRRFSAASVQRVVSGGRPVALKTRNRRKDDAAVRQ